MLNTLSFAAGSHDVPSLSRTSTFFVDFPLAIGEYCGGMFSLQQLFGKSDKFHQLLEAAAQEAHDSVRLVLQLIKHPREKQTLDDLVLARCKQKKIAEQISEELVKTFLTGLEREDIEALAVALRKIPKTAEKFAGRWELAAAHLEGVDFTRQAELMEQATGVLLTMVQQLHDMKHLEKLKNLNDKLQYVEGEADKLMLELLRELYSGKFDALRAIVIRDLYELMEKVVDRCRDAGNIIMHIMLSNS
ncbi:MAG TPA: pit accessory protein [Verrucomicrobiota bacterium]|jgi:hypothetical protein|nr:pit accessory protein [Verrucomicrobiota bacterium]OQC63393.1 MAG: hypothetical protein BWX48_03234 [Verrucomicrobia bacterium ADurb.Bin006]HOA62470.1 pit accessory protein [Verrucomicrobiota bacterium]HOF49739.1 pit accessory protein [Verrucomicrobiota bacterium]HOG88394.1 pit accessory protein [Verrucomicrobiota bacterium]